MLNRILSLAAAASVIAASALAAPSDYRIEGTSTQTGSTTELNVRSFHVPSGTYVSDSRVWHVSTHQSFKAPSPVAETRRALIPDGRGNYRLNLPLHVHGNSLERVALAVRAEPAVIVADIATPASK